MCNEVDYLLIELAVSKSQTILGIKKYIWLFPENCWHLSNIMIGD